MNSIKVAALALALVVVPAASRAQQRDTVKKRVDTVKVDTAKKESTAEKVGRQTGASVDKAAKTTEHNAKVLGKRTADNTKEGAKDTKSDVSKAASKAGSATKTNAKHAASATKTNIRHLKKDFKKATADTVRPAPKP